MRVVSLLPAVTEWICALGGRHLLVGRSHACTVPYSAQQLPEVTIAEEPPVEERPSRVLAHELLGKLFFRPDVEALQALEPDLVVVQQTCTLCAPGIEMVENPPSGTWEVFPFTLPIRFKRVLDNVLRLARRMGIQEEAYHYIGDAEVRLRTLHYETEKLRTGMRPRVLMLVHTDPPVVGGYWIADQIWHAGGEPDLSVSGVAPRRIRPADIPALDPDVLVIAASGVPAYVAEHIEATRAYREGKVYRVSDPTYFLRPGPRLYEGAEALASILYPELDRPPSSFIQPWRM